jgi:acetoin utilization deacetylase AcuC-like enzyme
MPNEPFCVYRDDYVMDMGEHVFPVRKYQMTYAGLIADGILSPEDLCAPEPASYEDLRLVHTAAYLERLHQLASLGWGFLTPDTPVTEEIVEKSVLAAGGTILTGRLALREGIAVHLSGGFHHASADNGEGFCYINDVAVAIRRLQADGLVRRAAIVDLDVHQGNGNALIFRGDPDVFTLSMHQERNYPGLKPPSDLDIGLRDGTSDEDYLRLLREALPRVLDDHRPDIVFYLAGADPYEQDQLGGLSLTIEGLRVRDETVLDACRRRGIAVAVTLAGGYAVRTEDTVTIHCNTVAAAAARVRAERQGTYA